MRLEEILSWNRDKITYLAEEKQDLLIYTYDQNLDSASSYQFFVPNETYKFRLSSIKREKDLRKEL